MIGSDIYCNCWGGDKLKKVVLPTVKGDHRKSICARYGSPSGKQSVLMDVRWKQYVGEEKFNPAVI